MRSAMSAVSQLPGRGPTDVDVGKKPVNMSIDWAGG